MMSAREPFAQTGGAELILLFSITAMVVVAFVVASKKSRRPSHYGAVVLFSLRRFRASSHVFIHEEETGTATALRFSAFATATSKYRSYGVQHAASPGDYQANAVPMFVIRWTCSWTGLRIPKYVIETGTGAWRGCNHCRSDCREGQGGLSTERWPPGIPPADSDDVRAGDPASSDDGCIQTGDIARGPGGLASFGILLC